MMRILHVIDQQGDVAPAALLRLSADVAHHEHLEQGGAHAWLLLGGESMRDAAYAVGLSPDEFILMPRPIGMRKFLAAFAGRTRQLMAQANRVVCWTEGASQLASVLGCAHAIRRVSDATLCPLARDVITQASGSIVAHNAVDRELLRQRWGFKEQTRVIALIGDHFDQLDMRAAIMAMAFTHEALRAAQPDHSDIRLLCHPLTRRRAEASLFSELLHCDELLFQDAEIAMPWSVLPGCDLALAPWPESAGLSMLWAEAMGVPILTPRDASLPLLEEMNYVVYSRSNKPKDLADALTNWAMRLPAHSAC